MLRVGVLVVFVTSNPPTRVIKLSEQEAGCIPPWQYTESASEALLVWFPVAVGMAITCTEPLPPAATFPIDQVMVPVVPMVGAVLAVGEALIYTKLPGKVSLTVTLLAAALPVF